MIANTFTESDRKRFFQKVAKEPGENGCWLWTAAKNNRGYGRFGIGSSRTVLAHRFAFALEHGRIGASELCCHTCDVKACVRASHLFKGTAADNSADMLSKGRQAAGGRNGARCHPERVPKGERSGHAKLNSAQVRDIRAQAASGTTQKQLAALFGVRRGAISKIVSRRNWKHLE